MLIETEDPWLLIQFLKFTLVSFLSMSQGEMEDLIDPLQDLFVMVLKILQNVKNNGHLLSNSGVQLVTLVPSYCVFVINLLFNLATKAEY